MPCRARRRGAVGAAWALPGPRGGSCSHPCGCASTACPWPEHARKLYTQQDAQQAGMHVRAPASPPAAPAAMKAALCSLRHSTTSSSSVVRITSMILSILAPGAGGQKRAVGGRVAEARGWGATPAETRGAAARAAAILQLQPQQRQPRAVLQRPDQRFEAVDLAGARRRARGAGRGGRPHPKPALPCRPGPPGST